MTGGRIRGKYPSTISKGTLPVDELIAELIANSTVVMYFTQFDLFLLT